MKKTVCIAVLSLLFASLVVGCAAPPSPVDGIFLFKARLGQVLLPPTGPFAGTGDAHPTGVQMTFNPGDRMFIILSMRDDLESNVTFSLYTFFNEETRQEVEVGSPQDFQTWGPGQTNLVALQNPWLVPAQPGKYQLRIYQGKRVAASAVFLVEQQS
ncbi:MAG: hypothetical protein HY670_03570 [Chloroflexi bacterium]|nr:hypothetical protein [Chloroflexota bacterium]